MTTLAFDGRLVAIDSLVSVGDLKLTEDKSYKITTEDGTKLWAFGAGSVNDIQECVRRLTAGDLMLPKGDYQLLVVGLDDEPVIFEGDRKPTHSRGLPYVAGSGAQAAQAALLLGQDAKGAVEVACRVDLHTGGPVRVFDTKTKRFRRKSP